MHASRNDNNSITFGFCLELLQNDNSIVRAFFCYRYFLEVSRTGNRFVEFEFFEKEKDTQLRLTNIITEDYKSDVH